jgi:hypothetical protein
MKKISLLSGLFCLSISVGAAVLYPATEQVPGNAVAATATEPSDQGCEKIGVYENVLDPCGSAGQQTIYERLSEQIAPSEGRDDILALIQSLSGKEIEGGGVDVGALNDYLDEQIGEDPIALSTVCQAGWCVTALTSNAEDLDRLEMIGDGTPKLSERTSHNKQTFTTVQGDSAWLVMVTY